MSSLQEIWDNVINAPDDTSKSQELDRFLRSLAETESAEFALRDASSVGDVLANILLENLAVYEERKHVDVGDVNTSKHYPRLDYLSSLGSPLLCALASLSIRGVLCSQELCKVLLELCVDCLAYVSSNASILNGKQSDCQLPKLDLWFDNSSSCATNVLSTCGGHAADNDDGMQHISMTNLTSTLLLTAQGLCLEILQRQAPLWLTAISQFLSDVGSLVQRVGHMYTNPDNSQSVAEYLRFLVGLTSRVIHSVYSHLSQSPMCVVLLEKSSIFSSSMELASIILRHPGTSRESPAFMRVVELFHSLFQLLSSKVPLSLSVPLVHQFVESDGPSVLLQMTSIDSEQGCDGQCHGSSIGHASIPHVFYTLIMAACRLQLPLLGFPAASQVSCSDVSQALSLSAADSNSCLCSKLTVSALQCISCCTCPDILHSLVPAMYHMIPCLCISSQDWLKHFLTIYSKCGGYPKLHQQLLYCLLQSVQQPATSHSLLHFDTSASGHELHEDLDDGTCHWLFSLVPYHDILNKSPLNLALPLVEHLGFLAASSTWSHTKICWEVAVPLLQSLSADGADDSRIPVLQSCLLLTAYVLGTVADQTKFLSGFPWQICLDKWLGNSDLHQYAIPLCEVILTSSIEQVTSLSPLDDHATKLAIDYPNHLSFLTWLFSTVFWNPTRISTGDGGGGGVCHRLHWDMMLLSCASCLSILVSHWVHVVIIKQMIGVVGGPEALMVTLTATLGSALHLLNQTAVESSDSVHLPLLAPLVHRAIAIIQLLSAVMFHHGDTDQDISSGLDNLEGALLGLCKLPNMLLVPLSNALVQLSTFTAHTDCKGKLAWPAWPAVEGDGMDANVASSRGGDTVSTFSRKGHRTGNQIGLNTDSAVDFQGFSDSASTSTNGSSISRRGYGGSVSDSLAYEGDVESEDEQPVLKRPVRRANLNVPNQPVLPAAGEENTVRLHVPELPRVLARMAANIPEVCVGQMLLGSLSKIASSSWLNSASLAEQNIAEHCLEYFAPMFAATQRTGLEETVVSFLLVLCKWHMTSEALYLVFRLIINSGCMQNRLLLLSALSELADNPYMPSHSVAFQLGAQPSPRISDQIETLCMEMESCGSWPRSGISFTVRCCLQCEIVEKEDDSNTTWLLVTVGTANHHIQLGVDSSGSLLVWFRWKEKQDFLEPLRFDRMLKFGVWYHIGAVLETSKDQASVSMYVNGVAVGSKPIPAWSMPTPLPAGSLYCEIGMDNSLLVPNSSPTETAGHAVTSPDNTTPIIEAQEAIDRAASTLSVDDVLNVPYHSTLLVSSALVFDAPISAVAMFALYSSGHSSIGIDHIVLFKGPPVNEPAWMADVHEHYTNSWWSHMTSTSQMTIKPDQWSLAESQKLMSHLCMGYTASSPSHWYCFHCHSPSAHSSNGTVPARITGGLPRALRCTHMKDSVLAVGGMRAILYLAGLCGAWDAERKCDGQNLLPQALQLIFALSKHHAANWLDLAQCDGPHLLRQVMLTARYSANTETLQVLLNHICDKPIVYFSEEGILAVLPGCDGIIVRSDYIKAVLLEWRVWQKAGLAVWYASLHSILALISEPHPHSEFNISQCQKADVLHCLISVCRDFPEETGRPVPDAIVRTIDSMITVFLGSPPNMEVLGSLCNFLISERSQSVIHNISDSLLNPLEGIDGRADRPISTSTPGRHMKTRLARTPRRSYSRSHPISKLSAQNVGDLDEEGGMHRLSDDQRKIPDDSAKQVNPAKQASAQAGSTMAVAGVGGSETNPKNRTLSSAASGKQVSRKGLSSLPPLKMPPLVSISPVAGKSKHYSGSSAEDEVDGGAVSHHVAAADSFLFSPPVEPVEAPSFHHDKSTYEIPDPDHLMVLTPNKGHRTSRATRHYGEPSGSEVTSSLEARILTQLHNNINIVADSQVKTVLSLLPAEALLVLADNENIYLRTAVVKTLYVMLSRGGKQFRQTIVELKGFHLLANQLVRHPISVELIDACWSLLLQGPSIITDANLTFLDTALETGECCVDAVVPLLVLLPQCLPAHMAICYNSILSLRVLLPAVAGLCERLVQNGLVDFLTQVLFILHRLSLEAQTSSAYDHVALAVRHFCAAFVVHTCSSSGATIFSMFEEFVSHIAALEKQYAVEGGENMDMGKIQCLRALHYFLLTSALQVFSGSSQVCPPPPLSWGGRAEANMTDQGSSGIAGVRQRLSFQHVHMASKSDLSQRLMAVCLMATNLACGAENCFTSDLSRRLSRGLSLTVTPTGTEDYMTVDSSFVTTPKKTGSVPDCTGDTDVGIPMVAAVFGVSRTQAHQQFIEIIFKTVLDITQHFVPPKRSFNTEWAKLCQQVPGIRPLCARLIMLILHPQHAARDRCFLLDQLNAVPSFEDIFRQLLSTSLAHKLVARLILYLRQLLRHHKNAYTRQQEACGLSLMRLALDTGFSLLPSVANTDDILKRSAGSMYQPLLVMAQTERQWRHQEKLVNERWWETHAAVLKQFRSASRQLHRTINSSSQVAQGLAFTRQRQVAGLLLDAMKASFDQLHRTATLWRNLANLFCHCRALWYTPISWPHHWQIDPTEAPNRTRLRMQPCYLDIEARFLLPDRRRIRTAIHPCHNELAYLFNSQHSLLLEPGAANRGLLDSGESLTAILPCKSITPGHTTSGEILIGRDSVYFIGEESVTDANISAILQGNTDVQCLLWPYGDIIEILCRRYNLKNNAMEIFLASNKTVLLAFESTSSRDEAFAALMALPLPNLMDYNDAVKGSFLRQSIKQKWQEGYLSNFEYLTHLNKLAGRSFNDLMQYPVFPFILADYTSGELDLDNPATFRDLSKPIAVQDATKVAKYQEKYDYMDHEYRNVEPSDRMHHWTPYHYGSHYSNAGIVLHFLVRLMPYTKLFLDFQDQNFDIPDRTFHNMATTWKLASSLSSSDVKELIPEFFYLPEFLLNEEGFAFGVRQDEHVVHDVQLPAWANNDPRLFILRHREALESEYVSQHLHLWIDLIFGYRQTGPAARESVNVFHPATYSGMDISSISDPVRRRAVEQMVRTYGQTPSQLFTSPHPARYAGSTNVLKVSWSLLDTAAVSLESVLSTKSNQPVTGIALSNRGEVEATLGMNRCYLALFWKRSIVQCDVTWLWCDGRVSISVVDESVALPSRSSRRAAQICLPALGNGHQVTCCGATPQGDLLLGCSDGLLRVVGLGGAKHRLLKQQFNLKTGCCLLLAGHYCAITSLAVSREYSVCVTGDERGRCILWDLHRFTFIRSLPMPDRPSSVTCLTVSTTLGCIACGASQSGHKSVLDSWTINGHVVGHQSVSSRILCLAYSTATEGVNVNVLAAGLQEGVVRLFSSWNLTVIRDIPLTPSPYNPVLTVTFTKDSQYLYAGDSAGNIRGWGIISCRH